MRFSEREVGFVALEGRASARPGARGSAPLQILGACLLFVLLWSAAAFADAPADMNEWCPIMPEDRAKPEYYADHDGARIYFCCARCRGRFERNPEGFPEALALAEERAEVARHEHDHDEAHDADEPHAVHDHHDHDHGVDNPLLNWLGRFHPVAVHFPIAFLIVAAGTELIRLRRDRPILADGARFCVWVGSVGAVIAAILGWFFGGFHITDGDWVMTAHRWLGTGAALWALAILYTSETSRRTNDPGRRRAYLFLLFAGAALIGATGYLGGSLIYGIDHLMW